MHFDPGTIFCAATWGGAGGPLGPRDVAPVLPSWLAPKPTAESLRKPPTVVPPSVRRPPTRIPTAMPPVEIEEGPDPRDEMLAAQAQRIADLEALLAATVHDAARFRRRVLEESEPQVVRLAATVASRVCAREIVTEPALVAAWVQEGIEHLHGNDRIEIAVAPDIAEAIDVTSLRREDGPAIEMHVDPSLAPGSCELRGEFSRVDVSLRARLGAVTSAMGIAGEESEP